ncbi:heavy metal sensor histidine kinase [Crenobacter luteus]|uniref:heavy metal sensor histidine kinase n=1 Tax=Crenobacter luteus TaxID=1452487 RepID=UPI000B287A82|nr:heavy metal sensor histidine kinase [Crenobacter luteus]
MSNKHAGSLTLRVALGFAVLTVFLVASSGVYLYLALKQEMAQRDREELAGKITLFQKAIAFVPDVASLRREPGVLTHFLIGHESLALRVRDEAGRVVVASPASLPHTATQGLPPGLVSLAGSGVDGHAWKGLAAPAALANGERVRLEVWRATHQQLALLEWYRNHLVVAGFAATLVAAALGWLLVRRSLRPLFALTRSAQAIHRHTLSQRLDAGRVPRELQGLVDSFNGVLERLDRAFAQLTDYANDLAHEMRTPLGILLGQTQVALSRERTVAEYQRVLADNAEALEGLARTVNDLLFLAKLENAQNHLSFETLDLDAEAKRVCEFFEMLAEEKNIRLVITGTLRLEADRGALRRLFNNLISNAIRYSPPGGVVQVTMEPSLPGFVVENAPANPLPDDLSAMFDRFYSRGEKGEGHGLGLPIAAAIARLHGGELRAERRGGRLGLVARFGGASASPV